MKTTKDQLTKENATLTQKLENFKEQDLARRTVLSELLESYEWTSEYGYSNKTQKILVRDWLGIAFLIGELKADANYAMVLESKQRLLEEVDRLRREVMELKNPPKQS